MLNSKLLALFLFLLGHMSSSLIPGWQKVRFRGSSVMLLALDLSLVLSGKSVDQGDVI